MADRLLPLLRGKITRSERFQSPRRPDREPHLPKRDPQTHRDFLVAQIDQLAAEAAKRASDERDEAAVRELIAIYPTEGSKLNVKALADRGLDVRVVFKDAATEAVLLDAPSADLPHLRRKLTQYADPTKLTRVTRVPRNQETIAPIERIELEPLALRTGERLSNARLGSHEMQWFWLACRGGHNDPDGTAVSRGEIHRQATRVTKLGHPLREYLTTDHIVFFLRASFEQVRTIVLAVDCVYELDLAAAEIRDWLNLEDPPEADVRSVQLKPPAVDAPSVVLLDTGVVGEHVLVHPGLLSAHSVVPGDTSPIDADGHGTKMAGVILHADLGDTIERRAANLGHWLQSVRVLRRANNDALPDSERSLWPVTTVQAVLEAERADLQDRRRVYTMAVTAVHDDAPNATWWSDAIDQVAYNDGKGRLFIIATGNAPSDEVQLIERYPDLNHTHKLEDPAQAMNALTVGAYTEKANLPPDRRYDQFNVVAPRGGASPHTRAGACSHLSGLIKPDVVFEGGNVGFDGKVPDPSIGTLVTLTTSGAHAQTGKLGYIAMTSCAAAKAAHFAATLWREHPTLNPQTVRGLIVHSASWTDTMLRQSHSIDERLNLFGMGVPDLEVARACASDRATIIVEDSMPNRVLAGNDGTETDPQGSPQYTRHVKYFELPIPDTLGLDEGEHDLPAELRVTLSYFAEPYTRRGRTRGGLNLGWDMQGRFENPNQFASRINVEARKQNKLTEKTSGLDWKVGPQRRKRGSVQSDRWEGPASQLAGRKLIAVYPVLGPWDRSERTAWRSLSFSLIVTLRTPGSPIYMFIANKIASAVTTEITTNGSI